MQKSDAIQYVKSLQAQVEQLRAGARSEGLPLDIGTIETDVNHLVALALQADTPFVVRRVAKAAVRLSKELPIRVASAKTLRN